MKISVITVAFNSATTIGDTLASVAAQTHRNVEHIVIDGGSTDQTLELLERSGKHLSAVISGPDDGIYDAMNKGLKIATGDLVGFLNADDMFANTTVLADIAAATDDHVDAIYGDLQYISAQQPTRLVRHWRSGYYSLAQLKFGWMPPHPTFYARRELVKAVGEFDLRFRIAADYDFMLRCLTRREIHVTYVPKVLVKMRTGGASNRSLSAVWQKTSEDFGVLRKNHVGGVAALFCKNIRKIIQFQPLFKISD